MAPAASRRSLPATRRPLALRKASPAVAMSSCAPAESSPPVLSASRVRKWASVAAVMRPARLWSPAAEICTAPCVEAICPPLLSSTPVVSSSACSLRICPLSFTRLVLVIRVEPAAPMRPSRLSRCALESVTAPAPWRVPRLLSSPVTLICSGCAARVTIWPVLASAAASMPRGPDASSSPWLARVPTAEMCAPPSARVCPVSVALPAEARRRSQLGIAVLEGQVPVDAELEIALQRHQAPAAVHAQAALGRDQERSGWHTCRPAP